MIQIVGIYPVDSVVAPNTGEIGIIKRIHHHTTLAPIARLVKSAGNTLLSTPHKLDLYGQIEMPHRKITAIQDP
ncbi:MAG: hypothetical protein HOO98_01595 [Nitrospira sp.]|nr:hypothetical protein [Nitrospira sp.]